MSDIDELPKMRSRKYFKYMSDLIDKAEKTLPISVVGFTDYRTVGLNWIYPDGTKSGYTTMSFVMFLYLVNNYGKITKE